MGFENRKRDDHGHVIGNDEVDGQECQHGAGGKKSQNTTNKSKSLDKQKLIQIAKEKRPWQKNFSDDEVYEAISNSDIEKWTNENSNAFDDDYEEEFKVYENKIKEELNKVNNKESAEYVSDLIDNNMEAGYISEEKADELYNELDKKIDEFSSKGNPYDPEDLPDEGMSQEEINSYKSQFEPEDFGDARFYPTKSNMDGNRWVGRYRGIGEAHGLDRYNDYKSFNEKFKHVEDYNNTSIYQLPDGYYSINPNITSMSFRTVDALKDYLDKKNPEEHKYGIYWDGDIQRAYRGKGDDGQEYDMEGPDAYKAARKAQQAKQAEENLSKELMTSLKMPGDEVERFLKDLPEDKKKILVDWLLNTKRM